MIMFVEESVNFTLYDDIILLEWDLVLHVRQIKPHVILICKLNFFNLPILSSVLLKLIGSSRY